MDDNTILKEYLEWLEKHCHCDQDTWNCPDEDDCPHKMYASICWVKTEGG